MCIIVAKPSGVNMPKRETLEHCFNQNHDGAGYMYYHDHKVMIRKGFLTFNALWRSLTALRDLLEPTGVVIHFRMATHGAKDAGNCHPFPLSDDFGVMRQRRAECDVGIAHNGVISMPVDQGMSDTMCFIKYCLYPHRDTVKNSDVVFNDALIKLALQSSRLCIMNGVDGKIVMLGDWVQNEGVYYSNRNYNPPSRTTGTWFLDYDDNVPQSTPSAFTCCQHCYATRCSVSSVPCSLCFPRPNKPQYQRWPEDMPRLSDQGARELYYKRLLGDSTTITTQPQGKV